MKRIVLLLLMICLAKLAGAQIPDPISHQGLLTNTSGGPVSDATIATTGADGINMAAVKALIERTEKLQRQNQSRQAQVTALKTQQDTQNTAAVKATTAKFLFIVFLLAGLLLMALISGRVFSRETYPDSRSPEVIDSAAFNLQSRIAERLI